jgi:hypothetical protein
MNVESGNCPKLAKNLHRESPMSLKDSCRETTIFLVSVGIKASLGNSPQASCSAMAARLATASLPLDMRSSCQENSSAAMGGLSITVRKRAEHPM